MSKQRPCLRYSNAVACCFKVRPGPSPPFPREEALQVGFALERVPPLSCKDRPWRPRKGKREEEGNKKHKDEAERWLNRRNLLLDIRVADSLQPLQLFQISDLGSFDGLGRSTQLIFRPKDAKLIGIIRDFPKAVAKS